MNLIIFFKKKIKIEKEAEMIHKIQYNKKVRYEVFFIILNYNNSRSAAKAAEGIKQNVILKNYGILIVDNSSNDDSCQFLCTKFETNDDIYVIKNEINSGYAAGNNFGIKYIQSKLGGCDYIAITNPDVFFFEKTNLQLTIKKLKNDDTLAAVSPIQIMKNRFSEKQLGSKLPTGFDDLFYSTSSFFRKFDKSRYSKFLLNHQKLAYVEVLPGSFFIIKEKILNEISLFDEKTFLYYEERILGMKLKNAGYKQAVDFECFYIHKHKSINERNRKNFLWHYKIAWKSKFYYNKHYNPKHSKTVVFLLKLLYPIKFTQVFLYNIFKNK